MKPYGVKRNPELDMPDIQTIKEFGLNKSAGGKDYFKNKRTKKAIRRIYKKKERTNAKQSIKSDSENGNC